MVVKIERGSKRDAITGKRCNNKKERERPGGGRPRERLRERPRRERKDRQGQNHVRRKERKRRERERERARDGLCSAELEHGEIKGKRYFICLIIFIYSTVANKQKETNVAR